MANKTIHVASGPAPTTIGKGPINIRTPKLTESPESTATTIKIMMPAKTMKNPMINNTKNLLNMLDSSFAYFAIFL